MYSYELISHIAEVLKKRPVFFLIVVGLFLGLFSFFFGLFSIPLPEGVIGFYRMEPMTPFEYFYLIFSVVISALIVTVTFHSVRTKTISEDGSVTKTGSSAKGNTSSVFGIATGLFGAVCPACLGINFLLLGNVFTAQLSFLIPYIFWIQLGGIALLIVGLYFVTKSSYEKKCISCSVKSKNNKTRDNVDNASSENLFIKILAAAAVFLLVFQVYFVFSDSTSAKTDKENTLLAGGKVISIDSTIEEVTPEAGFKTEVKWGSVVQKMIAEGVLDPIKLESILAKRYGQEMKPQWRSVLDGEDANLEISNDNAVFMMYLLWVLAKHNENQILFDSPFAKYFSNYDIGVGRAGYGDTPLLSLTPAQQKIAKEVSENAYRPCCGNSTARPDCSHGFSALGLVQLMASQDFSKEEIFDVFVKFNSFWFPETYIKDALYFKIVEGKNWSETDKELVAGRDYSSLTGSYKVKNYLKEKFGI